MAEVSASGRFRTALERLSHQVGHWTPSRFAAPASGGGSKGDAVYALVQQLADLAADAEGRPRRRVPRLPDTSLPDQLKVLATDLLAATPDGEVLGAATAAIRETARAL